MEIDEAFDAFRAGYPSAREAVAACENPIWLLRIAFAAAKDKKSIIRSATRAGHMREEAWWAPFATFIPVPEPYEAFDRWSGETTEEEELATSREWNLFRAAFLPVMTAWILWMLIATARLWTSLQWHRTAVASLIAVGVVVVGYWLMRRCVRWIVRAQIARFNADSNKALTTALARLTRFVKANPEKIERAIWWLRDGCLEVLDREAAFQ